MSDRKDQSPRLSTQAVLRKHNLRPRKGLGQNFLTDRRAAERIVAAAGIKPGERVVEIGPGLGALTFPLIHAGAEVIALEADRSLAAVLKDRLGKKFAPRVEIVLGDALAFDFAGLPAGTKVIGNLPYHIASPLIFKLLEAGPAVGLAVLTLQKELADRILSPPGPKTYGQITVKVGLKAKVEPILTLKPGAFYPPPKVASKTIRLTFGQAPPLPLADEELFAKIVQAAFGQRRKTLRQALLAAPLGWNIDVLEEIFAAAEVEPTQRAEKLAVADFIRLANAAAGQRRAND